MTLTVKELEALRPADKGRILSDGGSVWGSVHVAKDGAVSVRFSLTYRFGGIKRNTRLGTWPDVGITDIRRARDTFKAKLKTEGDPVLIEQAAREEQRKQAEIERLKAEADHQQALKAEQDRAEQDRIKAEADHQQALLEQRQRLEVRRCRPYHPVAFDACAHDQHRGHAPVVLALAGVVLRRAAKV